MRLLYTPVIRRQQDGILGLFDVSVDPIGMHLLPMYLARRYLVAWHWYCLPKLHLTNTRLTGNPPCLLTSSSKRGVGSIRRMEGGLMR